MVQPTCMAESADSPSHGTSSTGDLIMDQITMSLEHSDLMTIVHGSEQE